MCSWCVCVCVCGIAKLKDPGPPGVHSGAFYPHPWTPGPVNDRTCTCLSCHTHRTSQAHPSVHSRGKTNTVHTCGWVCLRVPTPGVWTGPPHLVDELDHLLVGHPVVQPVGGQDDELVMLPVEAAGLDHGVGGDVRHVPAVRRERPVAPLQVPVPHGPCDHEAACHPQGAHGAHPHRERASGEGGGW